MDKPEGIYQKYQIQKTDGSPVDPSADYFVLRLDKDPAARVAALAYAQEPTVSKDLARDLKERLSRYKSGSPAYRIATSDQPTIESAMNAVLGNIHTLSEELNQRPKRDIDEISITSEMVNLTIALRNLYDFKVKSTTEAQ